MMMLMIVRTGGDNKFTLHSVALIFTLMMMMMMTDDDAEGK